MGVPGWPPKTCPCPFWLLVPRWIGFVLRTGIQIPAARYDTCHGWPHLDVVNGRGELVLKRWMEERDIGEVFQQALLDFKKNHEKYK